MLTTGLQSALVRSCMDAGGHTFSLQHCQADTLAASDQTRWQQETRDDASCRACKTTLRGGEVLPQVDLHSMFVYEVSNFKPPNKP